MIELIDQLKLFEMTLPYPADGPDCLEGAIAEINRRTFSDTQQIDVIRREELIDQTKRM